MVAAARAGETVSIVNSADYILELEFKHPAAGWVRAATAPSTIQQVLDEEVAAHQARVNAAVRKANANRKRRRRRR